MSLNFLIPLYIVTFNTQAQILLFSCRFFFILELLLVYVIWLQKRRIL